MRFLRDLVKDTNGATAIEYGLIAALVSVAIIAVLGLLGGSLEDTFTEVQQSLAGAAGGGGGGGAP